jgi:hypothetical protein
MKTLLKLAGSLLIGILIGFAIAVIGDVLSEGESFVQAFKSLFDKDFLPKMVFIILLDVLVAYLLHIAIHEAGHLVAGLLTGYRFVSYRFMNWTVIRKDGRLHWRNFELAGTGGQCLMAPPDKPIEQIDTRWYNAGGVLANILLVVIAAVLLFALDLPTWANEFLSIMIVIGILVALTNGIPMKLGGVANDGRNLLQMEKDLPAKQSFCNILEINARSQEGQTYGEMPERLFELPQPFDWKNAMHVGSALSLATWLMARHRWEDTYQLLTEALDNKDDIMALYQLELENMMTQVCIVMGRDDEARQHYSKDIAKYVSRHAPTQSDKQFTAMAVALALDGDRPRAEKIYKELEANRDTYIHQGDVALSLDLMHWLLDNKRDNYQTT